MADYMNNRKKNYVKYAQYLILIFQLALKCLFVNKYFGSFPRLMFEDYFDMKFISIGQLHLHVTLLKFF